MSQYFGTAHHEAIRGLEGCGKLCGCDASQTVTLREPFSKEHHHS